MIDHCMRLLRIVPLAGFWLAVSGIVVFTANGCFNCQLPGKQESAFSIVTSMMYVFFAPGFVWGWVIRIKPRHIMEFLACCAAVSLTIHVITLVFVILANLNLKQWCLLIMCQIMLGVCLLMYTVIRSRSVPIYFRGIGFDRHDYSVLLSYLGVIGVMFMCFLSYRWGEDLFDICGEKLLHLTYVRYYYSLPLFINDLGISPGIPPPNLVNFWEIMLSASARFANLDPLLVFYRARFVIPLLGMSGLYVLARAVFVSHRKTNIIFTMAVVLALSGVLAYDNLKFLRTDDTRWMMCFMGTSHHADSAMEGLLPLLCGFTALFIRTGRCVLWFMVTGLLFVAYLWHPREYFQVASYLAALFVLFICFDGRVRFRGLLRVVTLVLTCLIVVVCVSGILKYAGASASALSKEMALKGRIFQELLQLKGLFSLNCNLFTFMGIQVEKEAMVLSKPCYYLWLFLLYASLPVLAFLGGKEEKRLCKFVITYLLLFLLWEFGVYAMWLLTYSEFYMTTQRLLYLGVYICLPASIYLIVQALYGCFERLSHCEIYSMIRDRKVLLVGGAILMISLIIYCAAMIKVGALLSEQSVLRISSMVPWVVILVLATVMAVWSKKLPGKMSALSAKKAMSLFVLFGLFGFLINQVWALLPVLTSLVGFGINCVAFIMVAATLGCLILRRGELYKHDRIDEKRGGVVSLVALMILLLCIMPWRYLASGVFLKERSSLALFGEVTPLGMSIKSINYLNSIPFKKNVFTDPGGSNVVSVYCPHYNVIFPSVVPSVLSAKSHIEDCRQGRIPFFGESHCDHSEACQWLNQMKVDYVLLSGAHCARLRCYFLSNKEAYSIVVDDAQNNNMIVQVKKLEKTD